jgi:FkbH-like protein
MTGGPRRRQVTRLASFAGRLVRDPKYTAHVLDVVMQQARPRQAPATLSVPWLAGRRCYFVGGCELTYVKEHFEQQGAVVFHTFDHGRGPEPLAEVADPDSPVWTFEPDVVVLSQVQLTGGVFSRTQRSTLDLGREDQERDLDVLAGDFRGAVELLRERFTCPIVLMTHPHVYRPSLGFSEYRARAALSLAEMARLYVLRVYDVARELPDVHVLDVEYALERVGKDRALRGDTELLGEHFTSEGALALTERLVAMLAATTPAARKIKLAIFDLDNTLWTGVLREDGPSGLVARNQFVRAARMLAGRGIVLAVCSKNDPVELELLPDILGQHFVDLLVATELSWRPKSEVIREIVDRLGIGLDTVAFFDDNERERAEVAMHLPEVLTLADTDIIESLNRPEFQPFGVVSDGALTRASTYRAEAARAAVQTSAGPGANRETFLATLELRLTLRTPTEADLGRVAELLQRSNQLNATQRRTGLAELRTMLATHPGGMLVAELEDRFGEYGLIGVAVAAPTDGAWDVAELAFSCRAMGKDVEHATLLELAARADRAGARSIRLGFHRTPRNGEMERILREVGMVTTSEDGDDLVLERELGRGDVASPAWIEVIRR